MSAGLPQHDPGFTPMALDLLGNVLARASNPTGLAAFLTEELRELTGARTVVFTDESEGGPAPRVVALDPARRRPWIESPPGQRVLQLARELPEAVLVSAAEIPSPDSRQPAGTGSGGRALGALLQDQGFDLSLVVPLAVGPLRVGTLLVLGDPDAAHARAVLTLLDMLSTVVALVVRNAFLFEQQEQVIATRTRELRQANEALRASRDRVRLALSGNHFVWDWDLLHGVLSVEPEWAAWNGNPSAVLEGDVREILSRIVHPEDLDLVMERNLAHQRGETPLYESEHRTLRQDGAVRWVLVRGRVLDRGPDGRAHHMVGVTTDVTEHRTMQAKLERAERLAGMGTLAAGVAHEINNPLTFIGSSVSFVAQRLRELGLADAEIDSALADAKDGTQRVREVVRGLQAFSRPRTPTPEPVDLGAELRAAIRITGNELRHRARLAVEIGPLPAIAAGGHQIGQVFVNLLVNAGQAIPAGGEDVATITVAAATEPGGWARVEVRDTGVGIPEAHQRRIFDPFFTTKPLGIGTGLGLAISHGIVTAAGGTIEVESAVGRGTTMRVRLPPAAALPPSAPTPPPATPVRPTRTERARVLVVDDEPAVARAARRLLAPTYDVEVAHSAAEALSILDGDGAVQAIVCDLLMPGVTGMALYRELNARRPALAACFVFATGGAFTSEAQQFLTAVGRPWVEKPFDPALLLDAVREVTEGSRASRG